VLVALSITTPLLPATAALAAMPSTLLLGLVN
jgi:hypothetical protein